MVGRNDIPVSTGFLSSWRRPAHALRPGGASRSWTRALALALTGLAGGLVTLALLGAGGIVWRLSSGPIPLPWLTPRIEKDLGKRLGPGYSVALGETALENGDDGPRFTIAGLTLKDPQGQVLVAVPKASVSVDAGALTTGNVAARRLELYDLDVRLAVKADGSLVVSAGADKSPGLQFVVPGRRAARAAEAPAPAPPANAVADMVAALRALLDAATDPGNSLGALDRLGIVRGRLVFVDETNGQQTIFDGLDLGFDKTDDASSLSASVNGPRGRWSLAMKTVGKAGADRTLDIDIRDITFADAALLSGAREHSFEFDMPVSLYVSLGLGAKSDLTRASAKFAFGAGYFKIADPDHEPMLIDEITGAFAWNADRQMISLEKADLFAGETHIGLAGSLSPPDAPGAGWKFDLAIAPGVIGPERPGDKPVAISQGKAQARYLPGERKFSLDRLQLSGPDFGLTLSGETIRTDAGPTLALDMSLTRMPLRSFVRLWPSLVAPQTRNWFINHATAGVIDTGAMHLAYDAATLADALADRPLPEQSVKFDFALTGGIVDIMPGLPPVSGFDGTGHVGGRTANFNAAHALFDLGNGRRVNLPELAVTFADLSVKPATANFNARFQSSLEALTELLSRDALKSFSALPEDAAQAKGQIEGQLQLDVRLVKKIGPDDVNVRFNAAASNFSIDKFIGKEKLEAATLNISGDKAGMRAKGEGRMFGAPAIIEMKKPGGGKGESSVALTIDEAARARLGLSAGTALTGPIGVKITAALNQGESGKAQVDVDLQRAAIDGLLPGWGKPAGKPGKASFVVSTGDDGALIEQLALDAGGVAIKGNADFDANGKFISAKFSQFRLSPGDDMRADATSGPEGLKLVVRGANIDARPFLQSFLGQSGDMQSARDIDIDLKSVAITGHNKQSLSGADLRLQRRAGQTRALQLTGKFGSDAASVSQTSNDGVNASYAIASQDAGAALSFLDLYRRMRGGRLAVDLKAGGGRQDGSISIQDFVVKDEPALRRISTETSAPAVPQSDAGVNQAEPPPSAIKLDPAAVPFTKLQASFTRSAGRTDIRDGVMWGPQVGATVEGFIDFARDRVDLNGNFVPAYQLNNFFSKIPLVGPILGGGKNEGLFAINYRVAGAASAPVLRVNPLSAIAPGFLRKIFGAIDGTSPPAAGAVPPARQTIER